MDENTAKVVVIGGGTGSFTLLSELKNHTKNITAIVNMADDGGSTGVLRDELGVLPPGDVRQCLVALSESEKLRDLFNYRFDAGTFGGHSFGNILLTALEKTTGNFSDAVETASEILRIEGKVVPATLDNVRLQMRWEDVKLTLHGERVIDADYFVNDPRKATLSLTPTATVNPAVIKAIATADLIAISPGDLYTSLGPLLVIDGVGEALANTKAKVVYVSNLVTKHGQTDGFTVADHAAEIERFAGRQVLDYVLYNTAHPSDDLAEKYEAEKAFIVEAGDVNAAHFKVIAGNYLGTLAEAEKSDKLPVTRSLIRHDAVAVAKELMRICCEKR
ncbi:MAG: gluconeogenesis factor YvcK family protein [Candidatus Saccharimonadales bacterium]